MANTIIVIDTETLEFVNLFPVGANGAIVAGPNPQVSLETSEDPLTLMAVRDPETGSVTLQADPAKLEDHKAMLWSQLRTERNARLTASDWTQLPDARVDKDAWVEYRQKLRDLPGETQDPTSVVWPTAPQ
jgi:hypothetical protein